MASEDSDPLWAFVSRSSQSPEISASHRKSPPKVQVAAGARLYHICQAVGLRRAQTWCWNRRAIQNRNSYWISTQLLGIGNQANAKTPHSHLFTFKLAPFPLFNLHSFWKHRGAESSGSPASRAPSFLSLPLLEQLGRGRRVSFLAAEAASVATGHHAIFQSNVWSQVVCVVQKRQ